jgi:general secretion pathway protein G
MIVVLLIIGFIIGFVGPGIYKSLFKSEVKMTMMKMSKLKFALLEYRNDIGHFPTRREGGVEALLVKPAGPIGNKWRGKYLESEDDLEDKWGNPFEVNIPPLKYTDKYKYFEIISYGGDSVDAEEIVDGA